MTVDYTGTAHGLPWLQQTLTDSPVKQWNQWCNKCNQYTYHNSGGCTKCNKWDIPQVEETPCSSS